MSHEFHIHPVISIGGGVFSGGIIGALTGALIGAAIGVVSALATPWAGPTAIGMHCVTMGVYGSFLGAAFTAGVGVWLGYQVAREPHSPIEKHGAALAVLAGPLLGWILWAISKSRLDTPDFPGWVLPASLVISLALMAGACFAFGLVMGKRYSS